MLSILFLLLVSRWQLLVTLLCVFFVVCTSHNPTEWNNLSVFGVRIPLKELICHFFFKHFLFLTITCTNFSFMGVCTINYHHYWFCFSLLLCLRFLIACCGQTSGPHSVFYVIEHVHNCCFVPEKVILKKGCRVLRKKKVVIIFHVLVKARISTCHTS